MNTNFMPRLQRTWVAVGVTAGASTYSMVSGKSKEKKAKAGLAALKRPEFEVSPEYFDNKNQAAQLAQGGMTQASKDFYTNETERNLGSALSSGLYSGGSANDISKILEAHDNSLAKISSEDSAEHIKNIGLYMNANKDLAGQKSIAFGVNKLQPYKDSVKGFNEAINAGETQFNNGLSGLANAGVSAVTAGMNKDVLDGLKGSNSPKVQASDVHWSTGGASSAPAAITHSGVNMSANNGVADSPDGMMDADYWKSFMQ